MLVLKWEYKGIQKQATYSYQSKMLANDLIRTEGGGIPNLISHDIYALDSSLPKNGLKYYKTILAVRWQGQEGVLFDHYPSTQNASYQLRYGQGLPRPSDSKAA